MAIHSLPALAAFVLITAAGLGLDLWSKSHVFNSLLSRPGLAEEVRPLAQKAERNEFNPQDVLPFLNLHEKVGWNIKFTLSTNPGVVFGIAMPRVAVAIVSAVTICLVFYFFAAGDARAWMLHVALAFILAGALGNLYDRLFSQVSIPGMAAPIEHQVRDFVDLGDIHFLPFKINVGGHEYDNYPWIFNVADVLLVAGVGLLTVNWIVHGRRAKGEKTVGRR